MESAMGATKKKELFGQLAVREGFVTEHKLQEALRRQKETVVRDGKHKLIGLLMLEMGLLSNDQLIALLKEAQLDTTLHSHPHKAPSFGD
jgi:hypothetical protein